MTNDLNRGLLANALVLHDFVNKPIKLKDWFYYVEDWFKREGLLPNRISGRGDKLVGFDREKKRLEREGFESIQGGVWIGAIPPSVETEMVDFVAAVHLHFHANELGTLVLCWDDKTSPFERTYFESLVRDLSQYIKPQYGYGYQRNFDLGPTFYPFGILSGIDSFSEEAKQISKWGNEYGYSDGDYKTGMLRDIYPINLLSEAHLKEEVFGKSLQEWIESDPLHGELKPLTDTLWEWWVPVPQISKVKDALSPTGLIICI